MSTVLTIGILAGIVATLVFLVMSIFRTGRRMEMFGRACLCFFGTIAAIIALGATIESELEATMKSAATNEPAAQTDSEKEATLTRELDRTDQKRMARNLCFIWIEDSLHDPSSADFGRYWEWPVIVKDKDLYTTRATVRAKNAFGATVKSNFECVVHPTDNGQWMKIDLFES